jgi:hypothetical protein
MLVKFTESKNMSNMEMPTCYVGEFQNGVFHGKGMFYNSNESFYCGSFIDGVKEGFGMETYHHNHHNK